MPATWRDLLQLNLFLRNGLNWENYSTDFKRRWPSEIQKSTLNRLLRAVASKGKRKQAYHNSNTQRIEDPMIGLKSAWKLLWVWYSSLMRQGLRWMVLIWAGERMSECIGRVNFAPTRGMRHIYIGRHYWWWTWGTCASTRRRWNNIQCLL